eukprot:1194611-Prorocentrum_minimum.AAC.5
MLQRGEMQFHLPLVNHASRHAHRGRHHRHRPRRQLQRWDRHRGRQPHGRCHVNVLSADFRHQGGLVRHHHGLRVSEGLTHGTLGPRCRKS